MDREVQQLVEMGASAAQARAALRQYKDVMEAAEQIFEGKFDHISADADEETVGGSIREKEASKATRMVTPDDDDDEELDDDDDDDDGVEDYIDYDSDYDAKADAARGVQDVDPYAGIFFSKDRREEVIEIEEDPEFIVIPGTGKSVKTMSQGQWMKGCSEGGEQGFLFSLYDQLSHGTCPCPDCRHLSQRKKTDFFALYTDFSEYIDNLRNLVRQRCPKCSAEFCLACGETISKEKIHRPNAATDDDPLFHCSNLQGVILGVGLSMLEDLFMDQSRDAPKLTEKNSKKRKVQETADDIGDDEDMYYAPTAGKGKKSKGGVGYDGNTKEDTSGQTEALQIQTSKDERLASLLAAIRVYLPSLQRSGGGQTSDYLVHPTALAHLRRRFNYVGSALLRNDSLTDMSDRSVLYFELFEWLETISNHEALASMMAMPIMVPVTVKSVVTRQASSPTSRGIRERTVIYEGSSGPRELLEAIVIQSQAALKGLEGVKTTAESEIEEMTEEQKRMTTEDRNKGKEKEISVSPENRRLLQFCQRILSTANAIDRSLRETKGDAFVERLHASLPKIPSSHSSAPATVSAGATDEETRKRYVEWAFRARFEYCDLSLSSALNFKPNGNGNGNGNAVLPEDQVPNYKFFYNNEARLLANADIPKRSLAIAKELAVLTTNLPVSWDSSILLRVDESRVDIIKCLITGPEGTPYDNGCYMFDIFLGASYNQTPPSVKYMTTGGGKFRFNPNLYADGKVCLSLLGTWAGPGWISGKSTLLQVLISIQSMILCEEPYLNEPGWATCAGTPQSMAYSANVRRMVVSIAMLGMLKNPPEPFEDVIRTHFRLKARTIMTQLDRWLAEDDGRALLPDGGQIGPVLKKGQAEPDVGSSTNGFAKDVAEMKALLQALEKGEYPPKSTETQAMDVDA
ncbi:hypothetical protein M422DRAFT_72920 [Sphaerobolus stellatus SS14]|nr:hypothetical protein M422DRAFT_72920 [Sphaerobolus stellatus SS14]